MTVVPKEKRTVQRFQNASSVMVWGAISHKCPPSSPDLNPLDFSIWGYMVQKLQNHKFTSLEAFKKGIEKIWNEIHIDVVRAACSAFDGRLKQVVAAKGDSIRIPDQFYCFLILLCIIKQ